VCTAQHGAPGTIVAESREARAVATVLENLVAGHLAIATELDVDGPASDVDASQ